MRRFSDTEIGIFQFILLPIARINVFSLYALIRNSVCRRSFALHLHRILFRPGETWCIVIMKSHRANSFFLCKSSCVRIIFV